MKSRQKQNGKKKNEKEKNVVHERVALMIVMRMESEEAIVKEGYTFASVRVARLGI